MPESRLLRRSVKQSKRSLYGSLIAIVVIIFIALNFGPYLIGGLGGFIDKLTGKGNQNEIVTTSNDIAAPTLDALPQATPSAKIDITGHTDYTDGTVELFVNGTKRDEKTLDNSQTFKFENIKLSEGNNIINARLNIGNKRSPLSDDQQISYVNSAPKLDVSFPSDGQSFHKGDQQITIAGATDPGNDVNVNGQIAIVDNSGNFSLDFNLKNGDNQLTITATGPSGQTTQKQLKVSYSE